MTLVDEPATMRIAVPLDLLMISPRIVLPELAAPLRVSAPPEPAPWALNWMIGGKTQPGWLVPSIVTWSVMSGSGEPIVIVWGPAGRMLKVMVTGPGRAFASSMAARSVHTT